MPGDGAGQHARFDVLTDGDQLLRRMAVVDALDILLDDRTFIEIGRHIVRRRADDLHTTLVGLMSALSNLA